MNRPCEHCGCTDFVRYSSLNKKQCANCKSVRDWNRNESETPTVPNNRQTRTYKRKEDPDVAAG